MLVAVRAHEHIAVGLDPKYGLEKLPLGAVDDLVPGSRGCGRVAGSEARLGQWSNKQLDFCHGGCRLCVPLLTLLSTGLLLTRRKPHSPHLLMGLELVPKDLGHNQRGGGQRQRCLFSAQLTQFSSHRSGWSDWACKIWTRPKKKKGEKKLFLPEITK